MHPIQSIPVQSWTFEHESVIRIGRSTDNHVILYSAVVSRHHVELREVDSRWEVISLGANGTYVDSKRITQMPIVDSLVIRLARSGPNIQIHVGSLPPDSGKALQGDQTRAQRVKPSLSDVLPADVGRSVQPGGMSLIPNLEIPVTKQPEDDSSPLNHPSGDRRQQATDMSGVNGLPAVVPPADLVSCTHPRAQGNVLFCPDCGEPLQVTQTVGDYQVVKTVRQDPVGMTQLVWRNGQSLVLRTVNPEWQQPDILEAFTQQATQLLTLDHPGLPHFVDFFVNEGKPHLVRRRVYGQSFQQRVGRQGLLTQTEAIATIVQVCDTLDYLHQQSPALLHEDLRPENLIQQTVPAGNITLVGFVSLRSFVAERSEPSLYMAPEQAQGQKTVAADLFALGPILVFLLTGQAPDAFYAQREQGFRFYPEYVPGLATELVTIIRRLTSPQPEDRYATAKEVADALLSVSITA
ncbi:protein kinase domain-containing protein [Stenomitos frigidus]|uniref:protein kinase domain-containing protein n=1 Tax=Stenomitos frigidus TaxID=1886765 RepID=UPI001FEACB9E|nr:FHA domain-containing protein [Stenomitos frigidus]